MKVYQKDTHTNLFVNGGGHDVIFCQRGCLKPCGSVLLELITERETLSSPPSSCITRFWMND